MGLTPLLSAQTQQVHADAAPPQFDPFCALYVARDRNVPLVDMNEANGATIYLPGTHQDGRCIAAIVSRRLATIVEWEAKSVR